jgi:hypothetical protein
MPDYTRYLPPGVYVDAAASPTLSPVGAAPSSVCLIGKGAGYHTYSETVSFASVTSAVLTKKGIDVNTVVVSGFVTDPAVSGSSIPKTFTKDIPGSPGTPKDYSLTVDATGGAANSITTLVKTMGGLIESGYPEVVVSYQYTDADYYAVNTFEADYSAIEAAYGPALNPTTGAIVSRLSLAAQFAISNGATRIHMIALSGTGTVSQQFAEAYGLMSGSNNDADLVVPLWDSVTDGAVIGGLLQTLRAALLADANNAVLRTAVVGFESTYAGTPTQLAAVLATAPSRRVIVPWPNQYNYFNGYTNSTVVLPGYYMAAALAGQLSARSPQQPLTKKQPQGFSGIPVVVQRVLTKSVKNALAQAGACIIEVERSGVMSVRHGITTDFAGGPLKREISVVRAQDALYNLINSTLTAAALIGQPISAETPLYVKSIVSGALENAKGTGLIVDYLGLAVRQQVLPGGDPTVIEVRFSYRPTWPLNYVEVGFTVDTSTGDNTLTVANSNPVVVG